MQKEKVNSKEVLLKQISKINEYFNNKETIPEDEAVKTLLMVGMASKIGEKNTICHISRLDVRHNCYLTLQGSYKAISKEASIALNNPTNDNLAIIIGQFGILQYLKQYLEREKEIPLNILLEMNARVVKGISKSEKIFKKINNIERW